MPTTPPKHKLAILGITKDGKTFRPSDWVERLCGIMACFQPQHNSAGQAHIRYSPLVYPTLVNQHKAVIVDSELENIEPMAYAFILSFVRDNQLQLLDPYIEESQDKENVVSTPLS